MERRRWPRTILLFCFFLIALVYFSLSFSERERKEHGFNAVETAYKNGFNELVKKTPQNKEVFKQLKQLQEVRDNKLRWYDENDFEKQKEALNRGEIILAVMVPSEIETSELLSYSQGIMFIKSEPITEEWAGIAMAGVLIVVADESASDDLKDANFFLLSKAVIGEFADDKLDGEIEKIISKFGLASVEDALSFSVNEQFLDALEELDSAIMEKPALSRGELELRYDFYITALCFYFEEKEAGNQLAAFLEARRKTDSFVEQMRKSLRKQNRMSA